MAGALQFISVTTPSKFLFRGRPATGYATGEAAAIDYEIGHVGDDTTTSTAPQVQWLKDGLPAVHTPTNIPGTNGRLTSTLSFTFAASDAGVYQCVFTDTSSSEIFVTAPTRLDTGEYTIAVNSRGCIHQKALCPLIEHGIYREISSCMIGPVAGGGGGGGGAAVPLPNI